MRFRIIEKHKLEFKFEIQRRNFFVWEYASATRTLEEALAWLDDLEMKIHDRNNPRVVAERTLQPYQDRIY